MTNFIFNFLKCFFLFKLQWTQQTTCISQVLLMHFLYILNLILHDYFNFFKIIYHNSCVCLVVSSFIHEKKSPLYTKTQFWLNKMNCNSIGRYRYIQTFICTHLFRKLKRRKKNCTAHREASKQAGNCKQANPFTHNEVKYNCFSCKLATFFFISRVHICLKLNINILFLETNLQLQYL